MSTLKTLREELEQAERRVRGAKRLEKGLRHHEAEEAAERLREELATGPLGAPEERAKAIDLLHRRKGNPEGFELPPESRDPKQTGTRVRRVDVLADEND